MTLGARQPTSVPKLHLQEPGMPRRTRCGVALKGGSATGNWTIYAEQGTCRTCARMSGRDLCICGLVAKHTAACARSTAR